MSTQPLWLKHQQLARDQAAAIARACGDAVTTNPNVSFRRPVAARSPEGDPRRLRGIPAISSSITGAVPGSIPHVHGLRD